MAAGADADALARGLRLLGEEPAAHPVDAYLAYLDLLHQWNQAYNLTAITGRSQMVVYHVLDSLAILPYVRGTRCLDAGSGAGLPGLVLALARPDQHWQLVDSNRKKIRFLNHVLLELKPANVEVVHARIEDYRPQQAVSTVTSRALTSLSDFHRRARHLCAGDGILLAMKGVRRPLELEQLDAAGVTYQVHELRVPGMDAHRHLVLMG